jgi:hypothetical protein
MTTSNAGKLIRRFGRMQRTVLIVDAVLCLAIVAVSALAILGNLSLMVAPLDGFDGNPLPAKYLLAPAIALVAGLVACYASVRALRGQGLRRHLLLISLAAICLLYLVEAALHIVNIGSGGNLAFASTVASVSVLWWLLNLAFARDVLR